VPQHPGPDPGVVGPQQLVQHGVGRVGQLLELLLQSEEVGE
jgi:hypothetical protein